jgi:hypothetical protein
MKAQDVENRLRTLKTMLFYENRVKGLQIFIGHRILNMCMGDKMVTVNFKNLQNLSNKEALVYLNNIKEQLISQYLLEQL